MKSLCAGCTIQAGLEDSRQTLLKLVSEKKNMLDSVVVEKSQLLDQYIVECIKCDKRRTESKIENYYDIFGIHSTFYYYGHEHLLINLIPYIKTGVENNELVTVSLSKDLYDQLMTLLDFYGIDKTKVIFFPVKEMVIANNNNGIEGVKELISTLLKDIESKSFKGARIIGQPSFAIGETSKEDFLKLEKVLTDAFVGFKASGLCVYDAFDYIHHKDLIDDDIMSNSFTTHSHLLYNHSLYKLD